MTEKLAKEIKDCDDCPLHKYDCCGHWKSDGNGNPIEAPCESWNDNMLIYKGMYDYWGDMIIENRGNEMTKVFDIEKFVEDSKNRGYAKEHIDKDIEMWGNRLQGLTKKEINEMGYLVEVDWLIEKEVV